MKRTGKAYDVAAIRKAHAKAYTPWTPEEDTTLREAYSERSMTDGSRQASLENFITEWADRLGRKPGAIRSRIAKYEEGVEVRYQKKTSPSESLPQPEQSLQHIELNPFFEHALSRMEETDRNVFLTGRAGTGKSTLLSYFRQHTKKKVVVLAPTGVAALNVHGQTIHSFFKFKPDITLQGIKREYKKDDPENLYARLDTIVIDEISMVRSDLLDCVDKFLRLQRGNAHPFGGVQMIFIGDLYQLPPVVTGADREIFRTHYSSPYFFDAHVFTELQLEFIELEKVYRQKDDRFISLLNAVRNNSATDDHLADINKRYDPDFVPKTEQFNIYLTTTNKSADVINHEQLERLEGDVYLYTGQVNGSFDKQSFPTDVYLEVKIGAQVMMLHNDSAGRWVNGTIAKIVAIEPTEEDEDVIYIETADGEVEAVLPYTWELFRFSYDSKQNQLRSETVGTFTQYPLRLAWAVTIHKSQGKTFDNVIIDIGTGTFVHGQLYVALSRCRTLDGIVLKKPVLKKHIFMDWRVVKFVTRFQYQQSEEALPLSEKVRLLEEAVKEKKMLSIIYLKANDEKSKRVIHPFRVGEMRYLEKTFLGVEAYDENRQEERVFRIDRILKMEQG